MICWRKWKLHRKAVGGVREGAVNKYPGVTILKPLVGVEDNLASNLETFFTLAYPAEYELLFCVHSETDPAKGVATALMAKYPTVPARLFTKAADVGVNPKINNMVPAYEDSDHDLVLVSDSGIRMKPDTLTDMVDSMTDKTGLVSQMPFVCDRNGGFATTLEKVFFGTWFARMHLGADFLTIICCTGMSCLMRRSVLDELGGLRAFGCYMAEDQFIARGFVAKGWKLATASQPAWQNPGGATVSKFHSRAARWARLRIAMMPWFIVLEPLQECFLLGLAASWATALLFSWSALVVFLLHTLCWMLLDYVLLSVVQSTPLPFGKFEFAVTWLYRELTALPLFIYALAYPDIRWRDSGTYRLAWGGKARRVAEGSGVKVPLEGGASVPPPSPPPADLAILIHAQAAAAAVSAPVLGLKA